MPDTMDTPLREKDVEQQYPFLKAANLRNWRWADAKAGKAPRLPFFKIGRMVVYRKSDVEGFIARAYRGAPGVNLEGARG